ncbi:MAG: hypothetical protein LH629_02545, partial [Ignavibacteria bacterium]|nr:hypothetical protein [Ignavibacteria bacterium]
MKTTFEKSGLDKIKADAYTFFVYEDKKLFEDQIKYIQRILRIKFSELSLEDFKGKEGQTQLVYSGKYRIILSGIGKKEKISLEKLRVASSNSISKVNSVNIKKIAFEILSDEKITEGFVEVARAEVMGCI